MVMALARCRRSRADLRRIRSLCFDDTNSFSFILAGGGYCRGGGGGSGGGGLADNKAALAAQLKESGFFGGHLGLGMMGEEESKPKMMEESSHGGYPQIGDSYDDEDDDEDDEIDDDEDGEVGEENEEGMGKITSLDREEENLV